MRSRAKKDKNNKNDNMKQNNNLNHHSSNARDNRSVENGHADDVMKSAMCLNGENHIEKYDMVKHMKVGGIDAVSVFLLCRSLASKSGPQASFGRRDTVRPP